MGGGHILSSVFYIFKEVKLLVQSHMVLMSAIEFKRLTPKFISYSVLPPC